MAFTINKEVLRGVFEGNTHGEATSIKAVQYAVREAHRWRRSANVLPGRQVSRPVWEMWT